jgi:hypothetical protein
MLTCEMAHRDAGLFWIEQIDTDPTAARRARAPPAFEYRLRPSSASRRVM